MIIVGPFKYTRDKYNGELNWECDEFEGYLCHEGLSTALDTEFEIDHSYELRIYPKRPRGDVSKLTADTLFGCETVEDESGNEHEIGYDFADTIRSEFSHLEKDDKITFYIRPLDLGENPKVVSDSYYDREEAKLFVYADDGTEAIVDVDVSKLTWVESE